VALVAVAHEVLLLQLVLLDRGAHGTVNVEDAGADQLVQLLKGSGLLQGVGPLLVCGHRGQVRWRRKRVMALWDGVDLWAKLQVILAKLAHICRLALRL